MVASSSSESLSLRGLNVQWPFSQLLLSGKKTIEVRAYALGHRGIAHADEDMWLVETIGRTEDANRNAVCSDLAMPPRPTKAQVIGIVRFASSKKYASTMAFRTDSLYHRIRPEGAYHWNGEGERHGWIVASARMIAEPIPNPLKGMTGMARTTYQVNFAGTPAVAQIEKQFERQPEEEAKSHRSALDFVDSLVDKCADQNEIRIKLLEKYTASRCSQLMSHIKSLSSAAAFQKYDKKVQPPDDAWPLSRWLAIYFVAPLATNTYDADALYSALQPLLPYERMSVGWPRSDESLKGMLHKGLANEAAEAIRQGLLEASNPWLRTYMRDRQQSVSFLWDMQAGNLFRVLSTSPEFLERVPDALEICSSLDANIEGSSETAFEKDLYK